MTGAQLAGKVSVALTKKMEYRQRPLKDFGKILDGLFREGAGKEAEMDII